MLARTLINILIILSGPIVTVGVYLGSRREMTGWPVILIMVLVFSMITSVVTQKIYHSKKSAEGIIVGKSIAISMVIYVILASLIVFIYEPSDAGWLIVMIPFMIVFTSPMAFSVSFGVTRILTDLQSDR